MDIVISGTKFGWGYFTEKQPSGLFDIGTGAGNKALTHQAYAINFKNRNCIFTKYRIIKDVRGDKRTGFVAFSLFLPFNKKLSGKAIRSVLDRVESEYCQKYIPDGKNLEDVRENFDFLNTISAEYDKDISLNSSVFNEDMQSGTIDAAVVYFPYIYKDIQTQKETTLELEDIFDAPFQEEYTPYRQILFINKDLKRRDENPLVALQHSENDLTGKVDLKNKDYYLDKYNSSKGVKITANGKIRSDGKGNNLIRAKCKVEIKYSKDNRCYVPIYAQGSISDLSSEIHKYIEIKGNQVLLKYDAFLNPKPLIKSVTFEIIDQKGKSIDGAQIKIGDRHWETVNGSVTTIEFQGEDIIKQWEVSVRRESKNLYLNSKIIIPFNESELVLLTLQKQLIVNIFAKDIDNGYNIPNFKLYCNVGKGYHENGTEIIFTDDDIYKTWTIEVSKKEGQYTYSRKIEYCPANGDNPLHVPCQKNEDKRYKVDAGEQGKKTNECPEYTYNSSGNDLSKDYIQANKGYAFKKWELIDDTLVAQYEKQITPKQIAAIIAYTLVLGITIWALITFFGKEETTITSLQISEYVEGDAIYINTLIKYKENWGELEPKIKTIGGVAWYNPTTWFSGSNKAIPDSTDYKKWYIYQQKIDSAITKRQLLTSNKFAELKNQSFYSKQLHFKSSIEKMDSTQYAEVGRVLGDVSNLTLSQVADSINAILIKDQEKQKQQQGQEKGEMELKPKTETSTNTGTSIVKTTPMVQKPTEQPTQNESVSNDITSEIIDYIKGGELNEAKLKVYINSLGINQVLKNSIQLCLDFWELDGIGSGKTAKTYSAFQYKVNADNNLKNSKLKAFTDKMCKEENPSYRKIDKIKGLK
jgi:hypothetical protein